MAKKYTKVDKHNEDFFRKLISETSNLEMNVKFEFLGDVDAKTMLAATKMTPLPKAVSDNIDVVIVINEDVWDRLDDRLQLLAASELIHGIEFDGEKDTVSVKAKDFAVYADFLVHNEIADLITLHESIKSIQDKIKADKENEK